MEGLELFLSVQDGDGPGTGPGPGYGAGYGAGAGAGYGYGSGDGSGDGYGDGDGSGDGSGDGDGDGSGSGVKVVRGEVVHSIDGIATVIKKVFTSDALNGFAVGRIVKCDLTMERTYIAKRGGYFAHGTTLKEAIAEAEAKAMRNESVGNRIERFVEAFPLVDTFVSGHTLFKWHGILTGSCTQGRNAFCTNRGLSLDSEFTIAEFINLTIDAYNGEVIRLLKDKYISLQQQGGGEQEDEGVRNV